MVALKRRHFGVLLATFALVVSFFGLAQFGGAQAPASAAPLSCPEPTTNVSNKVTLDWDNAQLVDHTGRETKAVGDWWDLGIKLPWKTDGRVKAGDYFTYDAGGPLRHDRCGSCALGLPAGSARAWGAPGGHRVRRPGDRCAGRDAVRAHAAGLGVLRFGRLVLSALPCVRCCGRLRLAGAPGPRGRRSAGEAGHSVRVPECDWPTLDDGLSLADAALHSHLRRAQCVWRAFAGGGGVRPHRVGGVGTDRDWLRHRRGRGVLSRSRGVGTALARDEECEDSAAARPAARSRWRCPGFVDSGAPGSRAACWVW